MSPLPLPDPPWPHIERVQGSPERPPPRPGQAGAEAGPPGGGGAAHRRMSPSLLVPRLPSPCIRGAVGTGRLALEAGETKAQKGPEEAVQEL